MITYVFKALNLSSKQELTLEIESISIAEAMAKGKEDFFEKFFVAPEESSIRRK